MSFELGIFFLVYYLSAGLGVNLAYHRMLAHRSLKLPKNLARVFVTLGLPAGTPIQWVGTHRVHHSHADTDLDPHSPVQNGFMHAHVGWYLETTNFLFCLLYCLAGPFRMLFDAWHRPRTNQQFIAFAKDINEDRYYSFISKPIPYACLMVTHFIVPSTIVYWLGGLSGFLYYWLLMIFTYNIADCVDSLAHLWGKKFENSRSNARDVPILGFLSLGDGWHASHHEHPYSACHGLQKWQFDTVWQMIKILRYFGIATEVKLPRNNSEL